MALILNIETSGSICSVAIAEDDKLVGVLNGAEENDHASQITILISSLLNKFNLKVADLSAVSISGGPGSYTGLRIGTSTAKGLCHGLQIPLIAVDTLKVMAAGISDGDEKALICPMIDARRMEIFTAIYDKQGLEILSPCSMILTENSFRGYLENHKIIFFGTGVEKAEHFLNHQNAHFEKHHLHSAEMMCVESFQKWKNRDFADLNYFEPAYLKEVYTTTPKR